METNLVTSKDQQYGWEELPQQMVSILRETSGEDNIVAVRRRIQFSLVANSIKVVKQKLIDTLLDLNSSFPEMKNSFESNAENRDKANTIIHNHIYGDNAKSNIGVGNNISQEITTLNDPKVDKLISALETAGVQNESINELRDIISTETDKGNLTKKIMTWVGNVAAKTIEKGLDLEIPIVMEKINDFLWG